MYTNIYIYILKKEIHIYIYTYIYIYIVIYILINDCIPSETEGDRGFEKAVRGGGAEPVLERLYLLPERQRPQQPGGVASSGLRPSNVRATRLAPGVDA